MSEDNIRVYPGLAELSSAAASEIAQIAADAIAARGRCTVALSGGNTPRALYEVLAKDFKDSIDWRDMHLFFGDERYVLHDDPASNYRMVKESLLDHIPIPQRNVFPIPTQPMMPEEAASAYSQDLVSEFGEGTPAFDLVLLGLGGDGHTASLFPGLDFETMKGKLVVATDSPITPHARLSTTMDVINHARNVIFLVAGEEKAGILKAVLNSRGDVEPKYPAARVRGNVRWFVDRAANQDSAGYG